MSNSEWDETPWAGSTAIVPAEPQIIHARTIPPGAAEVVKAATGLGVLSMTYNPPLFGSRREPQEMMKKFLKAYRVGWFYKAGSVIASDVSTTEIILKRENGDEVPRPPREKEFASLNPIDQAARLLDMPNSQQTWRQFLEKTQIRLDMAGNNFWYLDELDDDNCPTAMWNISPARMWPSTRKNIIIGWVMDWNERGGGVPFTADEITHLSYGSADDDVFGVGVVEAVLAEWENSELLARHVSDVLTLGGRLAGMISPKERSLDENEFQDTLRAWRAMANSGDAARRLLVFPEPVEWTRGSATPQEIGLPGLNEITRTNILSAFPISEMRLGVPVEAGLNSGDTRKHMFREHFEFTIHPRLAIILEQLQKKVIDRFSTKAGEELTVEFKERNRDDAPTMLEKAAAFRALLNLGFDPVSIIPEVGLDNIKWDPALLQQMIMQAFLGAAEQGGSVAGEASLGKGQQQRNNAGNTQSQKNALTSIPNPLLQGDVGQRIFINDSNRKDNITVSQQLTTQRKASRSGPGREALPRLQKNAGSVLSDFMKEQRERIIKKVRTVWPRTKAARKDFDDEQMWWDDLAEDAALRDALEDFLKGANTLAIQNVANELDRVIAEELYSNAMDQAWDLALTDINSINANTKDAIKTLLQEAARRGYSVSQVIDGVPADNWTGLQDLLLDNGFDAWGDARAETIARTELMNAYNRGSLLGYSALGVTRVQAKDGDLDDTCRDRDGREYSINEALRIRDHPNGTLDWIPLAREF